MSNRAQRAPTKPAEPKPLRVPKAAIGQMKECHARLQGIQAEWIALTQMAAGFLDIDPKQVAAWNLDTGEVSMIPERPSLPPPTPIREPESDAPTS